MLKIRLDDGFKLKLKTLLKSKPDLKCPKHVRFNPAQGAGAIVGNCSGCWDAMNAHAYYLAMRQAVGDYLVAIVPFDTAKPRVAKSAKEKPDTHCKSCEIGPKGHEYDCPEAQE